MVSEGALGLPEPTRQGAAASGDNPVSVSSLESPVLPPWITALTSAIGLSEW